MNQGYTLWPQPEKWSIKVAQEISNKSKQKVRLLHYKVISDNKLILEKRVQALNGRR